MRVSPALGGYPSVSEGQKTIDAGVGHERNGVFFR